MLIPNQRHLFDIPEELAYLNCAYISPSLKSVTKAGWRGITRKRRPWTIKANDFFDESEEARSLFMDYQSLMKLGGDYGKFDREGKKMFISRMESLMDRYKVFMKRFELSEDFQAKMTVEQLKTQLGQFGMTPDQMFDQMNLTLDRMRSELDASQS